jgi:energy-coupling factor transporter ATP-binding protein EcfA2
LQGEGRVVVLTGEPGIGKSRLTAALQERLQSQPHAEVRFFCSPHHTDSALICAGLEVKNKRATNTSFSFGGALSQCENGEGRDSLAASILVSPTKTDGKLRPSFRPSRTAGCFADLGAAATESRTIAHRLLALLLNPKGGAQLQACDF